MPTHEQFHRTHAHPKPMGMGGMGMDMGMGISCFKRMYTIPSDPILIDIQILSFQFTFSLSI